MDREYEPQEQEKKPLQQRKQRSRKRRQKRRRSRALLICACVAVFLIGTGFVCVNVYTRHLLSQAESLIGRRRYSEADVILAQLPDGERKTELLAEISYEEALEAVNARNYELANQLLRPFISEKLSEETKAKYNDLYLNILLQAGKYIEADELLSAMPETAEVRIMREQLYYESRILRCAQIVRDNLLYPESMVLYDAVLLEEITMDEEASTEAQNVYIETEPTCILYYGGQNKGGGITDSFVQLTWEDGDYKARRDVDTLEIDSDGEPPSYYDIFERIDFLNEQIAIININKALDLQKHIGSFDLDRVKGIVKNGFPDNVELIQHNSVVPQSTPRIELITPKPNESSGT